MNFIDYSLLIFIIINISLVVNFKKIKLFHYIIDKPDKQRKLHLRQIPLAGGIILIINVLIYFISEISTFGTVSNLSKKK